MLIHVTQEHIDRGFRHDSSSCPVALAMVDAGLPAPVVSTTWLAWDTDNVWQAALTFEALIQWISDFDAGNNVSPMTIKLENKEARIV